MEDPLQYTKDEIIKNLILTETHLKQATTGVDEQFCSECLDKHFYNLEGLGDEGIGFAKDKNELDLFSEVANVAKKFRGQNYKEKGVELAQEVRKIRKKFTYCPECEEELGAGNSIIVKKLTKDLNSKSSFNDSGDKHTQNSSDPKLNPKRSKNMVTYTELGLMNGGQVVAEAVEYAGDRFVPAYDKFVSFGGGLALQALGVFFLKRMPKMQLLSLVAGSNLLVKGFAKLVKPAIAPAVAVARVAVAPAIPTRLARAGILASPAAGRFEAPEHADLIRVD